MHIPSTYFSTFINRIRQSPQRIGHSGGLTPIRTSPVLSRDELRSLILDMVG